MPDEPTLEELFPNLAPAIRSMEGFAGGDSLRSDPDHHGVTDADIESYFAARLNGNGRTLAPVVSNQQPTGPTFRSGSTGMPPVGGMEVSSEGGEGTPTPATPPRQGNQPPNPSPPIQPAEMPQPFQTEGDGQDGDDDDQSGQDGQEAQSATDESSLGTEGGAPGAEGVGGNTPPTQLPPPVFVDLGDGVQVPIDRVRAYEEFNARLAQDPQLAALIQEYVTTGQVRGTATGAGGEGTGGSPQPSPSPASAQSTPSPFDNPPEDYADDPAFMALWNAQRAGYEAQQAQLAQVAALQQQQYAQQAAEQQQRNEQLANLGVERFSSQRPDLKPEEVANLRNVAVRLNVIPSLLSGIDPVTGAVTSTDPVSVVSRAMEIAYHTIPEYRNKEAAAATAAAAEQAKKDRQRRTKAGSLSGSSGSVPRSQPAPTTPEGNRAAMLQEVGAMMSGTWEGNQ